MREVFLGAVQGVVEWLPISSEGAIVLISSWLGETNLSALIASALFFHFGTFLAALVYFRREIIALIEGKDRQVSSFLFLTTFLTGLIGLAFLRFLNQFEKSLAGAINLLVGGLLIITGVLQIRTKEKGVKKAEDLTFIDGLLLGLLQGLAVLPGLSRSGLTVSGLLLRRFDKGLALKLSFLMSLPVVFLGNLALNLDKFSLSTNSLAGLASAFVFGFLTIGWLLKLASRINFGRFVLLFGLLLILSSLIL